MFKLRQITVKQQVIQLWITATVTLFYIILPNIVHAAECVSSSSGSACGG